MKTTQSIFLFIVLLLATAHRGKANEISWSLSNEYQSFYQQPPSSSNYLDKIEIGTKGSFEKKNFTLKLDTAINYVDAQSETKQDVRLNPKSLGLLKTIGHFDIFVGGLVLPVDGTDLNNIFDVFQAKDYRQPFNSETRGSVALQTQMSFENLTAQFFFIPKNERSLLPDMNSPWWPRTSALPVRNSSGTFLLPAQMKYRLSSENELNHPFDNNYGFSTKYTISNFDLHLMYFSGAAQTPQISPHFNIDVTSIEPLVGTITPPVDLSLTWYRSEHFGAGVTMLLGDWIGKVFCKSQIDHLAEDEKSSVCSASLESSAPFFGYSLHYFVQSNRQWKHSETNSELETLFGFFEKSSLLGFLFDLDTKGLLSGALIYNEKSPSTMSSVGYEYKWTDQFKTKLSLNSITSSGSLLADAYKKTSNASLIMKYDF